MAQAANPAKSQGSFIEPIIQYFRDFKVLKDNPIEFWAIQIVNFLDSAAYFALLNIAVVYLTETVGWDDVAAGYIVTALTSTVTVVLLFSGFITDYLGIRKSIIIAVSIELVSRLGLFWFGLVGGDSDLRRWLVAGFLVLSAPGVAMTITVFQAANKRYSTRRSRGASFNVWYLIMNLGAVAAGYSIDAVRLWLKLDNSYVFALAALSGVLAILTAVFIIRREDQALAEDEAEEEGETARPVQKRTPWQNFLALVRESAFWRFLVLMVALLGVRAAFTYMYLLTPKYWIRIIGEDVPMGFLQTINPTCIFFGLILFIPLANKFNVFKMLVFGASISAFSLLVLALPWQWFGPDIPTGYFRMSVVALIVLSVGEVIWSPKLSEYTAAIAPEGQEGSYLGMSMMPWFFAKTAVGLLSGHMLQRWVPEGIGERIAAGDLPFWDRPEAMWLILFLWAISGPIIAMFFSKWLTAGADLDPAAKAKARA